MNVKGWSVSALTVLCLLFNSQAIAQSSNSASDDAAEFSAKLNRIKDELLPFLSSRERKKLDGFRFGSDDLLLEDEIVRENGVRLILPEVAVVGRGKRIIVGLGWINLVELVNYTLQHDYFEVIMAIGKEPCPIHGEIPDLSEIAETNLTTNYFREIIESLDSKPDSYPYPDGFRTVYFHEVQPGMNSLNILHLNTLSSFIDCLMLVLAHEMGHVCLGHLDNWSNRTDLHESRNRELAADKFAMDLYFKFKGNLLNKIDGGSVVRQLKGEGRYQDYVTTSLWQGFFAVAVTDYLRYVAVKSPIRATTHPYFSDRLSVILDEYPIENVDARQQLKQSLQLFDEMIRTMGE